MPRSGWWRAFVLAAVAMAAGSLIVSGQITVPNTFVNGTVADAPQVNANFNALAANALNRTGGTMTGTLTARDVTPSADNTYSLGTHALRFVNLATTGTTEFATHVYTWSAVQGTSGQFLTNNGSDSLSWTSNIVTPDLGSCNLRATLTSGTPVTSADVTAATSVFVTPVRGGQCAFYDGAATWTLLTNAEVTVSVPASTSTLYDLWCRNNSGTIACDTTAWTNDTTRATALTTQNNVLVKTGDTTRRYIATFRTTTVNGQTEDSFAKRHVWNYYNRVARPLRVLEATDTWTYTTATLRCANTAGACVNQVDVVVGVADSPIDVEVVGYFINGSGASTDFGLVAIGEDSTSAMKSGTVTAPVSLNVTALQTTRAHLYTFPAVGRHFYAWLEFSTAVGTSTWRGDNGVPTSQQSGIHGVIVG